MGDWHGAGYGPFETTPYSHRSSSPNAEKNAEKNESELKRRLENSQESTLVDML
jgi:hypothetical protein